MLKFNYTIKSDWAGNNEPVEKIAANTLQTIDLLRAGDPTFHDFSMYKMREDKTDYELDLVTIDEARENAAKIIEQQVYIDDFGDASPEEGYWVFASDPEMAARSVSLGMLVGGHFRNNLEFEAGNIVAPPDPDFVTYGAFKTALVTLSKVWPIPWACAEAYVSGYYKVPLVPGEPLMPSSQFHIAWMAYLSAPYAAGLVPPPELISERTPGGGLLLSAVEERLDPTRAGHLRQSRILTEFLIDHLGVGGDPFAPPPAARIGPY